MNAPDDNFGNQPEPAAGNEHNVSTKEREPTAESANTGDTTSEPRAPGTRADLHLHSSASDGALDPDQLIDLVFARGLRCVSITDHDTIAGYRMALGRAEALGVQLIPGVEITSDFHGKECHILAYGFDPSAPGLQEFMQKQRELRFHRAGSIIRKLHGLGYDLELEDVQAEAGKGTISRNHIAAALVRKRYVATFKEAFGRLLGVRAPAYVSNGYRDFTEVIGLVHEWGGVAVLAHPGSLYNYEELREFMNAGIDGIEYVHPGHNYKVQRKLREYAMNYDLLLSGGSDFHGTRAHEEQFIGTICIDRVLADVLLSRCGIPVKRTVS